VTDNSGNSVTVSVLGLSDCTSYGNYIQDATFDNVTPNTSKGPGTPVCAGTIYGYELSVITPDLQSPEANSVCSDLDFSPMP
jgi:hypothetical protein